MVTIGSDSQGLGNLPVRVPICGNSSVRSLFQGSLNEGSSAAAPRPRPGVS